MTVKNNTLNNNDVGVQVQAGHLPYVANTNIDGDQNNLPDQYFGRGNSPIACGQTLSGNTFFDNTTDTRSVGRGQRHRAKPNTGEYFCSIQAAVDDADTLDGHNIVASDGVYNESPNVTKGVTLASLNGRDVTTITLQSGPTYLSALTVAASNVTI